MQQHVQDRVTYLGIVGTTHLYNSVHYLEPIQGSFPNIEMAKPYKRCQRNAFRDYYLIITTSWNLLFRLPVSPNLHIQSVPDGALLPDAVTVYRMQSMSTMVSVVQYHVIELTFLAILTVSSSNRGSSVCSAGCTLSISSFRRFTR